MIIAVDGPAAAGKGTLARGLASALGFHFLDTGSLYRMVGLAALAQQTALDDEPALAALALALKPDEVDARALRTDAVASAASRVAVLPAVRQALLGFQRRFARKPPGAVLDGRDVGTVVCPDAEVKFFVTASPEVRARRRVLELEGLGLTASYEDVLADLIRRDERDRSRTVAPLVAAADATVIDTSTLTAAQALELALTHVRSRAAGP
jgi:cytidylate kinase